MAASVVQICNRALQRLGAARIVALDENSPNARHCNVAYEPLRDRLLRMHPWVFAIKRFNLAADSVDPVYGGKKLYTVPEDFIRLASVDPEDDHVLRDWQLEGRKILTMDDAPLYGRYVSRVVDPNEMDPLFREALSCLMAHDLCELITQSSSKKAEIKDDMKDLIAEARKANAIERRPFASADAENIFRRL